MSVCRTVYEIFSVKEWRDLETRGRGRSRSLKMAPFDRWYTVVYWSAILSIAVCCTLLPPTKEEVNAFARVCLSVCLSVR